MRFSTAFTLCMAAGIAPALADSRDLVLDRLSRCYTLTDTRQYLECFYGAAQPLRNELGLAPAPQAATFSPLFSRPATAPAYAAPAPSAAAAAPVPAPVIRPQAAPPPSRGVASNLFSSMMGIETRRVAPEQFGLRNARPGPGVNVDRITARLADYSFDRGTGHFTVTLDNGQVWRQRAGDEHSPSWKKSASSYAVTIGYGANGSFNLTVAGERQPYKVERIR